jgi:hypothetical protein
LAAVTIFSQLIFLPYFSEKRSSEINMLKFRTYSLQNILREYLGSGLINMDINAVTEKNPSAQERG